MVLETWSDFHYLILVTYVWNDLFFKYKPARQTTHTQLINLLSNKKILIIEMTAYADYDVGQNDGLSDPFSKWLIRSVW